MAKFFEKVTDYRYSIVMGVVAFLAAFMIFPAGFDYLIMPIQNGEPWWILLDTSWMIVLNYVKIHNLNWGTDFVFTYGPLAQLSTRFTWGESRYLLLAFDLFVFVNWLLVFFVSLKKSKNKYLTFLLILAIALFVPVWVGGKISLYLLLFLAFWIRQSLEEKNILNYVMQISILVVCFFIKFNSALMCLPMYYLALAYMAYKKNINVKEILIYGLSPIVLIYALSAALNLSVYHYVTSAFDIISGYNEIMYEEYPMKGTYPYLIIVAGIVLSLIAFNFFTMKDQDIPKRLLIAFLTFVPFFVAYKQGFVRCNPGYNADFFCCALIFFLTASDLHYRISNRILNGLLLVAVLTSVHFLYYKSEKEFEISNRFSKSGYIDGFKNFSTDSDRHFKNSALKLPVTVLDKIGKGTVDAYPWNIRMIIENNLNYSPRPVIQAYSAYTPFLEELNFEVYNDPAKAPEYVIYEYNTLDNRYPLFDEPKVNIALKMNYTVAEIFDYDSKKFLLLRKKPDFKKVRFVKTKEYAMLLGSPLQPEKGVYYEIGIYQNLKAKAFSVVKHAPELRLEIQVKGGESVKFKTSPKLLETGIFGNDFIKASEDFADILNNGESKEKVYYYNFLPRNESYFKDKMRVTEYKVEQ